MHSGSWDESAVDYLGRDSLPHWAGKINIFPQANDGNSVMIEFINEIQKVAGVPGETVNAWDNENLKLALSCLFDHFIQSGPTLSGSACVIHELTDYCQVTSLGKLSNAGKLILWVLSQ